MSGADKTDLENAKRSLLYWKDLEFCQAIDDAFSKDESAVARHRRPAEKVKRVIETFSGLEGYHPLSQRGAIGGTILGYFGEPEETEGMESTEQEKVASSAIGQQEKEQQPEATETEGEWEVIETVD